MLSTLTAIFFLLAIMSTETNTEASDSRLEMEEMLNENSMDFYH